MVTGNRRRIGTPNLWRARQVFIQLRTVDLCAALAIIWWKMSKFRVESRGFDCPWRDSWSWPATIPDCMSLTTGFWNLRKEGYAASMRRQVKLMRSCDGDEDRAKMIVIRAVFSYNDASLPCWSKSWSLYGSMVQYYTSVCSGNVYTREHWNNRRLNCVEVTPFSSIYY